MKALGAATKRSVHMGKAKKRAEYHMKKAKALSKKPKDIFSSKALHQYELHRHHHNAALFFRRAYRNYEKGNQKKGDHHYKVAKEFEKLAKLFK